MPDNRVAPASHFAMAPADEVNAPDKGIASPAAEPRGGGPHGAAAPGAGGDTPVGGRIDGAVAAESQAKDVAPTPRSAPLPAEPVAKAFPESWREDLAGGDKAFRKTLDRFESPAALAKAYRELTARLSSGDLKATKPPPDNATPEQLAAWRAEQGLPQSATAYVDGLQLGDGTVTGKAEKTLLASFADEALKGRWTADQYNRAVRWYFDTQDRLAAQRDQADATFKHGASADLMREWGHDYATNRNAIAQFFDRSFPEDFREALLTARLPDGKVHQSERCSAAQCRGRRPIQRGEPHWRDRREIYARTARLRSLEKLLDRRFRRSHATGISRFARGARADPTPFVRRSDIPSTPDPQAQGPCDLARSGCGGPERLAISPADGKPCGACAGAGSGNQTPVVSG